MVCYAVPAAGMLVHYTLRRLRPSWRTSTYHSWLTLLLLGGALFGIVDHAWNGELLLVGPNIVNDLLLGIAITCAICAVWVIMVFVDSWKLNQGHDTTQ